MSVHAAMHMACSQAWIVKFVGATEVNGGFAKRFQTFLDQTLLLTRGNQHCQTTVQLQIKQLHIELICTARKQHRKSVLLWQD